MKLTNKLLSRFFKHTQLHKLSLVSALGIAATATLTSGGAYAQQILTVEENFSSGLGQFSNGGGRVNTGSYGVRLRGGASSAIVSSPISTKGFSSIRLSFDRSTYGLDSNEAGLAQLSINGGPFETIESQQSANGRVELALPTAADQQSISLRFALNANSFFESYTVDNVLLSGMGMGMDPDEEPVDEPVTPTQPEPPVDVLPNNAEPWSKPSTWGDNRVPAAGDDVVIPAGKTIALDVDSPALGQITIHGNLVFARKNLHLKAEGIAVHGTFAIGSKEEPFAQQATITLTGAVGDSATARGIMSHDGKVLFYGASPNKAWTKINAHAAANATQLTLADSVNWSSGDRIVVAPTDFYEHMSTETSLINNVNTNKVSLVSPLQKARWGRLQYLTSTGMSLSPGSLPALPAQNVPTVLDERAAVGNLSRRIVIEGADDTSWRDSGFGAHLMVMGANSDTWIEGVEFRRVGQAGRQGRYPVHFHLLSYTSAGDEIAKGGERMVRNNSVWNSSNRCMTIHGTNEVTLDNNICYDVKGHGIFLEDAVERDNIITNNLVLKVRYPETRYRLLDSDRDGDGTGSAGFWITNPDNTVRGNHAADSEGNGFWLSFPRKPLGLNKSVPIRPYRIPLKQFDYNTAHSNRRFDIQFDWVPYNDAGSVTPNHYQPTTDQQDPNGSNYTQFTMTGNAIWKGEGIWNRPVGVNFNEWIMADNVGMFFSGAGNDGRIKRALMVAESLNNATKWDEVDVDEPPTGFASYHSEYSMHDNVLVNFKLYPGLATRMHTGGTQFSHGGMLETKDYYLTPVDLGTVRVKNNLLINSHPGFRIAKPNSSGSHWTLAGAMWDAHGLWGDPGNYWVYDEPFLTSGTQCDEVAPVGQNGKSCVGPYFGLEGFTGKDVKHDGVPMRALNVVRVNNSGSEIGRWEVEDGRTGDRMLGHMRHAALVQGGRFHFNFYDEVTGSTFVPRDLFQVHLSNLKRPSDEVIVGLPFTGSQTASAYLSSYHVADLYPHRADQLVELKSVNSFAEVVAGNGDRMWQDKANNRVWVKAKSPARYDGSYNPDTVSLNTLHAGTFLRIFSCGNMAVNSNDAALRVCNR